MKATYCEVNGEGRDLFKAPKTDSKKNSHRGLIQVTHDGDKYEAHFPVTDAVANTGELVTVFEDGVQHGFETLTDIRARIAANLAKRKLSV